MKLLSEQAYEDLLRTQEQAERIQPKSDDVFADELIQKHYGELFGNVDDKIASMYEFVQTVTKCGVHYYDDCGGYHKVAALLLHFVTERTELLAREAHELRSKLHNGEYPKETLYIDACQYSCTHRVIRLQRAGQLIREQLQEQQEKEEGTEE